MSRGIIRHYEQNVWTLVIRALRKRGQSPSRGGDSKATSGNFQEISSLGHHLGKSFLAYGESIAQNP